MGQTLSKEVQKAIQAHVAKLSLREKQKVLIQVTFEEGGREAVDRFISTTAKELADALGFENYDVQTRGVGR